MINQYLIFLPESLRSYFYLKTSVSMKIKKVVSRKYGTKRNYICNLNFIKNESVYFYTDITTLRPSSSLQESIIGLTSES